MGRTFTLLMVSKTSFFGSSTKKNLYAWCRLIPYFWFLSYWELSKLDKINNIMLMPYFYLFIIFLTFKNISKTSGVNRKWSKSFFNKVSQKF